MKNIFALIILSLTACSNANRAAIHAWGKRHDIKCYSGGVLIYDGYTTGKVENEDHSDGYYFQDEATGKFTTITANCVITVDSK